MRHAQSYRTCGNLAVLVETLDRSVDALQRWPHIRQQRLSRFRQGKAPGGAKQQLHAQSVFQHAQRMRQRGGLQIQPCGRPAKAAGIGNGHES